MHTVPNCYSTIAVLCVHLNSFGFKSEHFTSALGQH